jgi:FtsP/CotA-like multicopper oxidase with cupredoxin domain
MGSETMKFSKCRPFLTAFAAAILWIPGIAGAVALVQCPSDDPANGGNGNGNISDDAPIPGVACVHVTGGDGFITMADGRELYIFSFADVSDVDAADVLDVGVFRATFPAPDIRVKEGDKLYLTVTNVGTFNRPDLFDPHTVHYHGFPNASTILDGVPNNSFSINQQASVTYWYTNVMPGTYAWHCHVEATEHMQMGMLGNLVVTPKQNELPPGTDLNGFTHGVDGNQYVYNDGDGSTAYDVEYMLMLAAMDGDFHDESFNTQPLSFGAMKDQYPMINGRGYPDTTLAIPDEGGLPGNYPPIPDDSTADPPQPIGALVTADQGETILLRIINLGIIQTYSMTALGLPMKVVGRGARLLRGDGQAVGENIFEDVTTVSLGGGVAMDILIDTTDVEPGTYFLYTTNMNYLSNNEEDYGGMMTEIVIN